MFIQGFHIFLFEQINQIHLSDHYHAFVIFIQTFNQYFIVAVVYTQSLVAGDDAYFRKRFDCETVDGFGDRYVDMNRTFTVVSCFQYGFVNQTVAEPFVFVGLHFG